MFIVEVDFNDGESERELLVLKRSYARIGSLETSHIILDGMDIPCEVQIEKSYGNTFRCVALPHVKGDTQRYDWAGLHRRYACLLLGNIMVSVFAVDSSVADFIMSRQQGKLNNRDALKALAPKEESIFPAIQSLTDPQIAVSLAGLEKCFLGRSRECHFRMDHPSLFPRHAVLKKNSDSFTIEGVSAENDIKVNGKQLQSGSRVLNGGDRIELIPSVRLVYLQDENNLEDIIDELDIDEIVPDKEIGRYSLRAVSGEINPKVITLREGQTVSIGRDPVQSIWINAVFISRLHCTITMYKDTFGITDYSSNGTVVNGEILSPKVETFFPQREIIHLIPGPDTEFLLSDLNDADFDRWCLDERISTESMVTESEPITSDVIAEDIIADSESEQDFSLPGKTDTGSEASMTWEASKKIIDPPSDVLVFDEFVTDLSSNREKMRDVKARSLQSGKIRSEDFGESFDSDSDSFQSFQRNQQRKLRDKEQLNYIDPDLSKSMEEYSYEKVARKTSVSSSRYILGLVSAVIILVFGISLFIISHVIL
jgi:pSer/pThr/pTyr-binding forkhead associated (FHA) protein